LLIDIELLKKIGTARKYSEEEIICRENDPGDEMYIILQGKVGIMLECVDGSCIKVGEICSGGFFGEMSVLEDLPRSATTISMGNTILLAIKKENFQVFIEKQPLTAINIMKGLSSRIRGLNSQIKRLSTADSSLRNLSDEIETPKKTATAVLSKADIEVSTESPIFPEGHKRYEFKGLSTNEDLVLKKSVTCPICGKNFETYMQRSTKLKLEKIDTDFRSHFEGFDQLFYNIWICPHCYYAENYNDFEKVRDGFKKIIQAATDKVKNNIPQATAWPDINALFAMYYLTLYYYRFTSPTPFKQGKTWMQLSWIYKDYGDLEMYEYCCEQALKHYHEGFFNTTVEMSIENEQQCSLLLGELYLRKKDMNTSYKLFAGAINKKAGSPIYNKMAEDQIQKLREMTKK